MYLEGHGKHIIRHKGGNGTPTFEYVINADGLAPVSKTRFITPYRHVAADKTRYYGRDLQIKVRSTDEMSGVEGLFMRVGDEEFAPYQSALDIAEEGEYKLQYYAIDRVGNQEKTKTESFIVDITPPTSNYNVVGIAKNNIVSTSTKIYLTIEDNSVGVAKTRYRFDDEAIYCSELIWRGWEAATGKELGTAVTLGSLNWQPYQAVIQAIEGPGNLPLDRKMITPRDLAKAKELKLVFPTE